VILKTPAIALRIHPYTETSRVITWLTPEEGRLNTLIKGAMRPRSAFLGQVDLFYTCELLYYGRNREALPVTREVAPMKTRGALRTDWRACAVASYLCGMVSRATPPQGTRHDVFDWLETALDDLAARGGTSAVLCWQELRLLGLLGLAPRLRACSACGAAPGDAEAAFSASEGVWRCARCQRATPLRDPIWTPGPALRALGEWQSGGAPETARTTALSFSQQAAAERALGQFLAFHLDIAPAARAAALDILARRPPQSIDRTPGLR
jgi:DNA repair protein RecO (recombination protein O)